jgi:hypothetical protein
MVQRLTRYRSATSVSVLFWAVGAAIVITPVSVTASEVGPLQGAGEAAARL